MATSLRTRLIVASVLWTAGLLLLMHLASLFFIHTLPSFQSMNLHVWIGLGLIAMIGGAFAARTSLVTLRRLRGKVEDVSGGAVTRVDGVYPVEVQPLIDSLNRMLEEREHSVRRAYAAAGDLAHGLKTPLALLSREADVARAAGQTELADAILGHVQRMSAHVDYHLARARVVASSPTRADRAPVRPRVEALVRALSKIYATRAIAFASDVEGDLHVRARREDLDEMLGNVLDNACKWARARVTVTARPHATGVMMTIDDDGPGLAPEKRAAALERGVRLDESAPGSGLGLSIVRELAEHYGGSISLDRSPLGGLRVQITLPGFGPVRHPA